MLYAKKSRIIEAVRIDDNAFEYFTKPVEGDEIPRLVGFFRDFGEGSTSYITIQFKAGGHPLSIEKVIVSSPTGDNTGYIGDYIVRNDTCDYCVVSGADFSKYYEKATPQDVQKSDTFNFGDAIKFLKQGLLVTRRGWNGKRMFLFFRPGIKIDVETFMGAKTVPDIVKKYYEKHFNGDTMGASGLPLMASFTGYICMKAADDTIVNGWLASQTDMLSEDWCIFEP